MLGIRRVALVGDGQVRRLADARATMGNWGTRLPDHERAIFSFTSVTPNGRPLRTITRLFSRGVELPLQTDLIVCALGGNDLDSTFVDAIYLARLYIRAILRMMRRNEVHRTLVLPVLHRRADGLRGPRSVYRDQRVRFLVEDVALHFNNRVDAFNVAMQALIYGRQDLGLIDISWGHLEGFDKSRPAWPR